MKTKFPQFASYACPGDSITWAKDGYTLTATIVYDQDSHPDESGCYSARAVEKWHGEEWFFCGIVLSVSFNGIELTDHAASLWGIECNINTSNCYLSTVAQELESEALAYAKAERQRIINKLEI